MGRGDGGAEWWEDVGKGGGDRGVEGARGGGGDGEPGGEVDMKRWRRDVEVERLGRGGGGIAGWTERCGELRGGEAKQWR